ncbi:MAG: hypothetical protein LBS77_07425 [Desulfovibrio sp.]|jgi:hypothetical protein|nr:hypothetical protein [Desulfovibrio sp.]
MQVETKNLIIFPLIALSIYLFFHTFTTTFPSLPTQGEQVWIEENITHTPAAPPKAPIVVDKPTPSPAGATLAIKNNNPANVKAPHDTYWEGQTGRDRHGHAVFTEREYGVRAAAIVLKVYARIHKIDTIAEIIDRFCDSGNEVKIRYARYVAAAIGVKPTTRINILDHLPSLLKSMIRWESGHDIPDRMVAGYSVASRSADE